MISEEQIIAYLSGEVRERFEDDVAKDPQSLRALVEQQKMDAALTMLLAQPERAQVKNSILAVIEGEAEVDVKSKIYERVEFETKRQAPAKSPGLWEWITSLPAPLQVVGLAMLATGVLLLLKPPMGENQIAHRGETNTVESPLKLPQKQPRDPVKWPFAAKSPWNAPIGSAAKYAEPVGVDLAAGIRMYDTQAVHPTIRASANASPNEMLLYRENEPQPVARVRVVKSQIPDSEMNFAVVSEDGKTIYDIVGGRRNGNDIIARRLVVADLTGSGMPGEYNAPTSTGFSDYAGSLCADDFNGPINRALGAVFHRSILARTPEGTAHVWPATRSPGGMASQVSPTGNLHVGTLLAIPLDVDLATIGVGNSGAAYEIAKAFQNFGLYLKKPHGGSPDGPQLGMCGDLRAANLPRDFPAQLAKVASYLKVVENNGPNSVGGGGTPGQPSAPEFK